jgi:hypothetical protein
VLSAFEQLLSVLPEVFLVAVMLALNPSRLVPVTYEPRSRTTSSGDGLR